MHSKTLHNSLPALAVISLSMLLLLFSSEFANAQPKKDTLVKKFRAGLNFGYYFASKSSANYYNGSAGNENKASWIMNNYYWYQDIFNLTRAADTVFISELPGNMHYKPTTLPGIYFDYTLGKQTIVFIEFNYSKLKIQDVITFEVDPKQYLTQKDIRLYPIRGVENRMMINLGLRQDFRKNEKTHYFLQAGVTMNNTRVLSNEFFVENKPFSMINIYGNRPYVPNTNLQAYQINQGGIGFGAHLGFGASFRFSEGLTLEPGGTLQYSNVQLIGYNGMALNGGIYIRFIFEKLL